jgi:hypothetical protein
VYSVCVQGQPVEIDVAQSCPCVLPAVCACVRAFIKAKLLNGVIVPASQPCVPAFAAIFDGVGQQLRSALLPAVVAAWWLHAARSVADWLAGCA